MNLKIKAILFDLDQTLLDRTTSLIHFLNWQINYFQLVPLKHKQDFIKRFIELDDNGKVWKDVVYKKIIQEFSIEISESTLLESYIQDFNKFSCGFDNMVTAIKQLKNLGYILGLISNGRSPFQEHNFYALGITEFFSIANLQI